MTRYITIDLETDIFAPGRKAPLPVCMSVDWGDQTQTLHAFGVPGMLRRNVQGLVFDRGYTAEQTFTHIVQLAQNDPSVYIVGHTFAYDAAVIQAHCPELRAGLWWLYDNHRVICELMAWKLLMNAQGRLQDKHPPPGNVAVLVKKWFDIDIPDKEDPEGPRFTFGQYKGRPVSEYSPQHQQYALDDARYEAMLIGQLLRDWHFEIPNLPGLEAVPDLTQRSKISFSSELTDCRGFITDAEHLDILRANSEKKVHEGRSKLTNLGLYKKDGKKNDAVVRRMVEHAYGRRALQEKLGNGQAEKVLERIEEGIDNFQLWLDARLDELSTAGQLRNDARSCELCDWRGRRRQECPACGEKTTPFTVAKVTKKAWTAFRSTPDSQILTDEQKQQYWKGYAEQALLEGKSQREATDWANWQMSRYQSHLEPWPGGGMWADLPWGTYFSAAPKTASGLVATDKETLVAIDDPYVEAYASYQLEEKLLSTFIPKLEVASREPFHPYTDCLKSTGRSSMSLFPSQQMSKAPGVRESIIARPGYLIATSDISIAELRALGQILSWKYKESRMARLLQEGKDLHLATAAALMGISYEEAEARHAAGDPEADKNRDLSKAMNFGLPGGLGARTFQIYALGYGVKITLEESKRLKRWWLGQYPEMRRYLDDIGTMASRNYADHQQRWQQAASDPNMNARERYLRAWVLRWPEIRDTGENRIKYVQAVSGRIRLIEGGRTYTQAANTGFQGLNGDVTLEAGYRIARGSFLEGAEPALYGTRTLSVIHDEILAEVPIFKAEAAANRIRDIIIETMNQYLPDIPAKADVALQRVWSKKAKPVFSETGQLIPWEYPGLERAT